MGIADILDSDAYNRYLQERIGFTLEDGIVDHWVRGRASDSGDGTTLTFSHVDDQGTIRRMVFRGNDLYEPSLGGDFQGVFDRIELIEIDPNNPTVEVVTARFRLPFDVSVSDLERAINEATRPGEHGRTPPADGPANSINFVTAPQVFDLFLPPDGGFGMFFTGGDGGERVNGYVTDDRLDGAAGNDTLRLSPGTDTIIGGAGEDIADGRLMPDAITLDGMTGNAGAAGFTLDGIEAVIGSAFGDVLDTGGVLRSVYGGGGDDVVVGRGRSELLSGNDGNDQITGGSGFDTIEGDDGNDVLTGADGYDQISGGAGDDSLTGNNGFDTLYGNDGDDTLLGGLGTDSLFGGRGEDLLSGQAGRDQIFGGGGNDTLDGNAGPDRLNGEDGNDVLNGGSNDDGLSGGTGNDILNGGSGADVIFGNEGDDRLSGNGGADTLWGNAGDDVLRGGLGADAFLFHVGDGHDRIADFGNNVDRVQLSRSLLAEANPVPDDLRSYATRDANGFVVLDFGPDSLTFTNVFTTGAILDDVVFV